MSDPEFKNIIIENCDNGLGNHPSAGTIYTKWKTYTDGGGVKSYGEWWRTEYGWGTDGLPFANPEGLGNDWKKQMKFSDATATAILSGSGILRSKLGITCRSLELLFNLTQGKGQLNFQQGGQNWFNLFDAKKFMMNRMPVGGWKPWEVGNSAAPPGGAQNPQNPNVPLGPGAGNLPPAQQQAIRRRQGGPLAGQ